MSDPTLIDGLPAWVDRDEYPFAPHWLDVPGGRLHYVDEGEGPAVVMVHGNPAWSFPYRTLILRLRGAYRCVAPDHLGFGLSEKPRGWSYLPQDHAANLERLIDGLGLRDVTLVVQDWGGPIGLAYAAAHPGNVSRLVITNSWAWPVNRDPYYLAFSGFMGGPVGRYLIGHHNFFAGTMMKRLFGDPGKLTAATHEQYLLPLADPRDRTGCMELPRQILRATPWLAELWRGVRGLGGKPALIVWGDRDIAFRRKELLRWESAFPMARVVHLPGAGHYVLEEAPDEVCDAVASFLTETAGRVGSG